MINLFNNLSLHWHIRQPAPAPEPANTADAPAPEPANTADAPAPEPANTADAPAPEPANTADAPAPEPANTADAPAPEPANTADAPGAPLGAACGGDAASFAQALPGGTVMPDGDVRWTKASWLGGDSRPFGTVGPDGRLHSGGEVGSLSSDGTVHWQEDPCWRAAYEGTYRDPSDEDDSPAATFARALGGQLMPDGDVWFRTSREFYVHGDTDNVGTVGSDGKLHSGNEIGSIISDGGVLFKGDPCSQQEP